VGVLGVRLTSPPMSFTKEARAASESACGATVELFGVAICTRPSGFNMGVHLAGSNVIVFGGIESETKSVPSYYVQLMSPGSVNI
jgi:hypothetical protein